MPAYPIPSWLQPADIAGQYAQGVHLGAQISEQQQRLAQAAAESDRQHMLEQQRLEVNKAYQKQEIELRQRELAQHQQQIDTATKTAANKFAAMQAYQQEIASGADPIKTIIKYGPAISGQASAEAAAIRAQQMAAQRGAGGLPNVPVIELGPNKEPFAMFPRATGGYQPMRLGTQAGMTEREMKLEGIKMDDRELSAREKAHAASDNARRALMSPAELDDLDKKFPGLKKQTQAWIEQGKGLAKERQALRDQLKSASAGGRRGKWNPQTRQVDWNVGTLPSDMTTVGAAASNDEEEVP